MAQRPSTHESRKSPLQRMSRNFFLHIHAPRVQLAGLRPTFTFGLGVCAAFLFLILLITGALLMLYYTPSVERAYASVKDIIFVIPGGRYIRNMHRWAGHGLVLVAFLHLARVFYTASYTKGRAFNWVIGASLLVIVLLLSFSGYLLPWDQLAYWAVTIGANIAASVRELTDLLGLTQIFDVGGFTKRILIGDETVGQDALTRFYMLHVVFLPVVMIVLIGVHFWRIRKDGGLNLPVRTNKLVNNTGAAPKIIDAWPTALWGELATLTLTLALLMLVSYFFDAPIKELANPFAPENPAKSPWYFLGIQELVSYSAFAGGVLIPLGFIAFIISIPFYDTDTKWSGLWFSGPMGRKVGIVSSIYAASATLFFLFISTKFGRLRSLLPQAPQFLFMLVNPGTLMAGSFILWANLVRRRTPSKRFAAIALFTCIMVGFIILTIVGLAFRGPNWQFYWSPATWPTL